MKYGIHRETISQENELSLSSKANSRFIDHTAKGIITACSLIEQGFEYVTEMEGIKIFRKRK